MVPEGRGFPEHERVEVVIVGHGPSLVGAGLGKAIDAHEKVLRLKNCSALLENKEDYGQRTDIMFSTTEVCYHLSKVKAEEYWCYPKYDTWNTDVVDNLRKQTNARIRVLSHQAFAWNKLFRDMGANHPNLSTGMAAAVCVLELLNPRVLTLAGFDVVFNPKLPYQSTVPTPFNEGGTKTTGNDWKSEHKLLHFLGKYFKTDITCLPLPALAKKATDSTGVAA